MASKNDDNVKLGPRARNAIGGGGVIVAAVAAAALVNMFVSSPASVESEVDRDKKLAYLEVVDAATAARDDEPEAEVEDWNSITKYSRQAAEDGKNIDDAIDKINNIKFSLTEEEKTSAEEELNNLSSVRDREGKALMRKLSDEAEALAAKKRFREAADVFQNYSPPADKRYLAKATREERVKLANEYYRQANELKEKNAAVAKLGRENRETLLNSLSELIIRGRFSEALKSFLKVQETNANPKIEEALTQLSDAEHHILKSFKKDIGKIIVVEHHGKKQRMKIKGVSNLRVQAEDKVGKIKVGVKFGVEDLSLAEREKRLRTVDLVPRNLYLGVNAMREGKHELVTKYFKKSGDFAEPLLSLCEEARRKQVDKAAKVGMIHLLKAADVKTKSFDAKEVGADLASKSYPSGKIKRLNGMVSTYRVKYDGCEFYEKHKGLLDALTAALNRSKKKIESEKPKVVVTMKPKKPKWNKKVRTKEDLFRALKSFNPGYDLKGDFTINADGDIVAVSLAGAKINDVTPLRGLDLASLDLAGTAVANISPLKRMPLSNLNLAGTKVLDLQPLKWCKELKNLNILDTSIVDLTPLRNLELERISFDPKKIQEKRSFKFLKEMDSLNTIKTPDKEESTVKFWIRYDAGEFESPNP